MGSYNLWEQWEMFKIFHPGQQAVIVDKSHLRISENRKHVE